MHRLASFYVAFLIRGIYDIFTPELTITVAIIFISIFGVILSLICIYSLPDQTVQPFIGAIFFICSAILVSFFLVLRWKKETAIYKDKKDSNTLTLQR